MRNPEPLVPPLLLHYFHAGWRREAEKFGRYRASREAGEVERCFVALAVRIRDALNRVRGRRDRDRDVADHRRRGARLQRGDDVAAARGLADDEVTVARGRIADQQERQLAAMCFVERRDSDLLLAGQVEPRAIAVENEDLLFRFRIRPAHHREGSEDDAAAVDLAVLESLRCESLRELPLGAGQRGRGALELGDAGGRVDEDERENE